MVFPLGSTTVAGAPHRGLIVVVVVCSSGFLTVTVVAALPDAGVYVVSVRWPSASHDFHGRP